MKNLIKNLLIVSSAAVITVGCRSKYPGSIVSISNPLNRSEAQITYDALRSGEEEFKGLERKFRQVLASGETNTLEFSELQRRYHSMKAQREKYEDILRLNQY